jgi:phospholipid/cholesterol/gamma-HCH transport system substrate-binding protein
MDTKVNYVAVGLFVLALLSVLIGVFIWLTTLRLSEPTLTYVTYLTDEVSGLGPRSPVRYNGVEVGFVSNIELSPKDPQIVRVELKIKRSAPITTATVASLMSEGITGVEYIGLKASRPNAPKLIPARGKAYAVIPSEHSFMVKMSDALQQVTTSITTLTKDIQKVFDEKNRVALAATLQSMATVTKTMADNADHIQSALNSADIFLKNSAAVSKDFPEIVAAVKRSANGFSLMLDQSQALIPTAEQLLLHVDGLSMSLQEVLNQVKTNPGVLLRGTSGPALGPGEHP